MANLIEKLLVGCAFVVKAPVHRANADAQYFGNMLKAARAIGRDLTYFVFDLIEQWRCCTDAQATVW